MAKQFFSKENWALIIFVCTSFSLVFGETLDVERDSVLADTKYGQIKGEIFVLKSGFKVNVFRGIPFAQPPVKELMFQKPVPPAPWNILKETNQWPNRCIQSTILGEFPEKFESDSVDCLYLNVFTPHSKSDLFPNSYPVIFWIHGGAYHFGSSLDIGLEGITEKIVPKDVVFVSIQYRLASYGFFKTATDQAPANLGLWDQTAALQWVRDNIANFHGDPGMVTVMGHSAGAGSASLLSLSPHSNNLFHQLVLMSGTHMCPWAANTNSEKFSKLLAKKLDCDLPSVPQMLDCLRTRTPSQITDAELKILKKTSTDDTPGFGVSPTMDGDFFPGTFEELMKQAPAKPTIAGTTIHEAGFVATPHTEKIQTIWTVSDETFSYKDFKSFLKKILPETKYRNAALIRRMALHHYVHTKGNKRNNTFLIDQYTQILTDSQGIVPQYLDAQQRLAAGSPVWLYSFDYSNPAAFSKHHKHKGAFHSMDVVYLFDAYYLFGIFEFTEEDKQMVELMTTLWTNFAKYGNPTFEPVSNVMWEPLTTSDPTQYMSLGPQPKMIPAYNRESLAFWNELIPDIERLDLVKTKTKTAESCKIETTPETERDEL